MVSLEQIQIVYYILAIIVLLLSFLYRIKTYEYLKKIGKWLHNEMRLLMVFLRELPHLWRICDENSRNYSSLVEFRASDGLIKAEDNDPSPRLEFTFSSSNFSIFDFETKKITMHAFCNTFGTESDLGVPTPMIEKMKVNHQKRNENSAKLQLHPSFINSLKTLKKQAHNQSVKIILDVKIDFTGDKEFHWDGSERSAFLTIEKTMFVLEIPMDRVYVTL